MTVSQNGGTESRITQAQIGNHAGPRFAPDSLSVLYTVVGIQAPEVWVRSLETGEEQMLVAGRNAKLTKSGLLLFNLNEAIWAVPFDQSALAVVGDPVLVRNGVDDFQIADDGTLLYTGATLDLIVETPVWVSKATEEETPLDLPSARYRVPRIADNGLIGLTLWDDERPYILVAHEDGSIRNQTPVGGPFYSIITSNAEHAIYPALLGGSLGLYRRSIQGTTPAEPFAGNKRSQFPRDSLPGVLLYDECDSIGTACDLGLLDLASEKQELYLASEENERQGAISPMQQLVAYESDVTGQPEIWVRPYPDVGRDKRMISRNGGRQPMWAADGSALYFIGVVGNQNWLMSVAVIDAKGFVFGEKKELFRTDQYSFDPAGSYDVHADGDRFLFLKPSNTQRVSYYVIKHWLADVERRLTLPES